MYAILIETKETIAAKKKEVENNQNHINSMALEMASLVNKNNNIKVQVEQLESELYRLEKQVQSEENRKRYDYDCSIAMPTCDTKQVNRF